MTTIDDWKGETGQEWSRRMAALEPLLGPAGTAAIEALGPTAGEHILDLGCGAGSTTAVLADQVAPGGHVTGIDISPDLLAIAREQLGSRSDVSLIESDAGAYAYPTGGFDAVYSRCGTMFFPDPTAAFGNIARALRPGARAVFVAWREPARNQWAAVPMSFVAEEMAGQSAAAPSEPGPFAWADPTVFLRLLEGAGFSGIHHRSFEFEAAISEGEDPDPVVRALSFMTQVGPLARRLRGAPEEAKAEAARFLSERLCRHVHGDQVRLLASAWIIEARWA